MVKNYYKGKIVRIPDEDENLEIVHLKLTTSNPPLHVIGVYLQVEGRQSVQELKSTWTKLKNKVDAILDTGEAAILMGDFNRPIDNTQSTCGKKLLYEWLNEGTMALLNDDTPTRIDWTTKKGSILDLAIISENIKECVKKFSVDSECEITPFTSKTKTKKFSDHRAITVDIELPMERPKKIKKKRVINFNNEDGWNLYKGMSDKFAKHIIDAVQNTEDVDELERNIKMIDIDI